MLDCVSSTPTASDGEEYSKQSVPTMNYVPYVTGITQKMEKYAELQLGETPATRERCLQEMRETLRGDVSLNYREDDNSLLKFLRSRRFNVPNAVMVLKRYYRYLQSHWSFFARYNPQAVEKFISDRIVSLLPFRDKKERAILVLRAGAWNVNSLPPDDAVFGGIVSLRSCLELPANQVMGYVCIIDLRNLSLRQILAISPYALFALRGLQSCCPCHVSAIHMVNIPGIFRIGWNIVRPLLSEKIKKRIVIHKNAGYQSLHEIFPQEILPEELGGHLGPIDNSHWANDVSKMHQEYSEEVQYGYADSNREKSRCTRHSTAETSVENNSAIGRITIT